MALVLTKERLNEFIKTGEVKEQSEIFEEFDITMSVIDSLLIRSTATSALFKSIFSIDFLFNLLLAGFPS